MKELFISFLILTASFTYSQEINSKKSTFYVYWGWNRGFYSTSDIHFKGENYNFTLQDVIAKDRQSAFNFETYFSPTKLTIPQYNFRIGYFLSDQYSVSIGADHMKYVMQQNQVVKINGEIQNSNTVYDGVYENNDLVLKPDFLIFEHTDGLNYENIELRHHHEFFTKEKANFSFFEGFGIGVLVPRTNTTLLNNKRYDEFHLAGYGMGVVGGLNFEFFKYFFVQTECKVGFIHMPDIRTTEFKSDRASQHFLFSQFNGVFGCRFPIGFKTKRFRSQD